MLRVVEQAKLAKAYVGLCESFRSIEVSNFSDTGDEDMMFITLTHENLRTLADLILDDNSAVAFFPPGVRP